MTSHDVAIVIITVFLALCFSVANWTGDRQNREIALLRFIAITLFILTVAIVVWIGNQSDGVPLYVQMITDTPGAK